MTSNALVTLLFTSRPYFATYLYSVAVLLLTALSNRMMRPVHLVRLFVIEGNLSKDSVGRQASTGSVQVTQGLLPNRESVTVRCIVRGALLPLYVVRLSVGLSICV